MYPRRPTTALFTLLLALTLLSILPPTLIYAKDATLTPACGQCIVSSRTAAYPVCSGLNAISPPSRKTGMTEQERNCYCGAAGSVAWLQSCINPVETCKNSTINGLIGTYGILKMACDYAGVRPPTIPGQDNDPSKGAPSSALSLSVASSLFAGVIVAAASAFLGALL